MPDDGDTFLEKAAAPAILASIESHIQQSRIAHLGQCQQLENWAWESLSSLPFVRDPALEYVSIMRQRYQSIFDFYDQEFLPALRGFNATATEVDQTLGANARDNARPGPKWPWRKA